MDYTNDGVEAPISKYLNLKAAANGTPISGTFELTNRCNFNCKMCYIHNSSCNSFAKNELTTREWLSICETAVSRGLVFLLLTGGEPLIRDDFAELYSGFSSLGVVISINSNGSLLCGKNAEIIKKIPPSKINVSLYGASDDTYLSLCGGKYFNIVSENIDRMLDNGIKIRLNLSVTPYNASDIDKIFEFAELRNIPVKATTYMYPPIRLGSAPGVNTARFSPEDAALYRMKCDILRLGKEKYQAKADNLSRLNECIDGRHFGNESVCRGGRSGYWVDYQGNMSMCGNVPESWSIAEYGFDECWRRVREYAATVRLPKKCSDCSYRTVCPVCVASCLAETGSFENPPEYLCEFSKNTMKYI